MRPPAQVELKLRYDAAKRLQSYPNLIQTEVFQWNLLTSFSYFGLRSLFGSLARFGSFKS
jgi:hypothetical protein